MGAKDTRRFMSRIFLSAVSSALVSCGVDFAERAAEKANQPPYVLPVSDQTAIEGETLTVRVTAGDQDGKAPCLFAETSGLGNLASFADEGEGKGVLSFTPDFIFSGREKSATVRIAACDAKVCGMVSGPFPDESTYCYGEMRAESLFNVRSGSESVMGSTNKGKGSTVLVDRFIEPPPEQYGLFGLQMRFSRDTKPGPMETNWQQETALYGRMIITSPGAQAVVIMRMTPKCKWTGEGGNVFTCTAGIDCPDAANCSVQSEDFFYEMDEAPVVVKFPPQIYANFLPGISVAPLSDVTGDGVTDLVLGAVDIRERNLDPFSPPCNGYVLVFDGLRDGGFSLDPRVIETPEQPPSGCAGFGNAVDTGDLDGDGVDDIVVGAPGGKSLVNTCMKGRVYIYLSSRGMPGSTEPVVVAPAGKDEDPCDDAWYKAGRSEFSKEYPSNSFGFALRVLRVSWGAPIFVVGAPTAIGKISVDRGDGTTKEFYAQAGQTIVFGFAKEQQKAFPLKKIDDKTPELISLFGMSVAVGGMEMTDGTIVFYVVSGSPGARLLSGKVQVSIMGYRNGRAGPIAQYEDVQKAAPQPERGAMFGFAVDTLFTLGSNFGIQPGFAVSAVRSGAAGVPKSGAVYLFPFLDSTPEMPPLVSVMYPPEPEEDSLFGYSITALSDSLFASEPFGTVAGTRKYQGRIVFFPPGVF